jgi:uncharacterized RDD family membrane protein YckC
MSIEAEAAGVDQTGAAASDSPAEKFSEVRPWARYLAKMLDFGIFMVPFFILMFLIGIGIALASIAAGQDPAPISGGPEPFAMQAMYFAISLVTMLVLFPLLEAIVISAAGGTPGKALMGISVRDIEGNKLRFGASFRRSFGAYAYGLGLGVPLVSFVTMIMSYNALNDAGSTRWDRNAGARYTSQPVGFLRWAVALLLFVIIKAIEIAVNLLP